MVIFEELSLIGQAPMFLATLRLIRRYAACEAPVLVLGETGTGKELAARAIHYLGARRDRPFIPINCGALPDTLVENELFGHARGAFTDGREATRGLIDDAERGTLFLDEVETLSLKAQVAFLRFLQDGVYRPLGARQSIKADVRIIAASNLDLHTLAERGEFRRDLIYRLQIGSLRMPALRERTGDAALLALHFFRRFARQYQQPHRKLDPGSLGRLEAHDWPGNVRELENLIHRAFILSESSLVCIDDGCFLSLAPNPGGEAGLPSAIPYDMGFSRAKKHVIEAFERNFVCWALSESLGNVSQAARRSEKERRTFGRLLKKYGIDKSEFL